MALKRRSKDGQLSKNSSKEPSFYNQHHPGRAATIDALSRFQLAGGDDVDGAQNPVSRHQTDLFNVEPYSTANGNMTS